MDVFAHASNALELSAVLDLVAKNCINGRAGDAVRAMTPGTDAAAIARSVSRVVDVRDYEAVEGRLGVIDTSARDELEVSLAEGGSISAEGLLRVAAAERAVLDLVRRVKSNETKSDTVTSAAERFIPHKPLIELIEATLDSDGSIKDGASPDLKSLRKQVQKAKGDIRSYTERYAKDLGSDEYVTFTGNRYMLVLPREKCKQRDGIVHSTSHSGGSLYFEPLTLVEKNNRLETLNLDVRAEEARILSMLTQRVVDAADALLSNADNWEALDVLCAKARFAAAFECVAPVLDHEGVVKIEDGRHPLLEVNLRDSGREAVPLRLELTRQANVLVITGPNAGGKTVTLKTVGLMVLMHQCGLPVPAAHGTRLPVFERVLADIGDEQSIAASLSTFTSHLKHLDGMCREADARTLCLVDEIGDGTDPDEGAALAIAALERLLAAGASVIATTHYGKIKSFALQTDGVSNASMVFDDDSGEPLYRLLQGTAGRSRGIETARRVGFFDAVVERAQALVGEAAFQLENLLGELEGLAVVARARAGRNSRAVRCAAGVG